MKWGIGILLSIAVAGAVAIGMGSGGSTASPTADQVQSTTAQTQTVISGIGYIEPLGEVRRLGFKLDGRIQKCNVRVGSTVKAGDVLLQLDDAEELAALRVAQAEVEAVKSDRAELLAGSHPDAITAAEHRFHQTEHLAEFAQRDHKRLLSLIETRSVSPTDADRASSQAKQTQAAVAAAKAELERLKHSPRPEEKAAAEARLVLAESKLAQAKARLDQTKVLAPFDGTVLELFKREGDVVHAIDGEPAVLFADVSKLRVRAEVDERFVYGLRIGMKAEVYGRPLGDKTYLGAVSMVKQLMGPKTVFSRASAERVDLDVVQLFIDMPAEFRFPVGLRVDVRITEPSSTK